MKFPLLCPRCEQGPDLHKVAVSGFQHPVFVCFECEATYEKEADIAAMRFTDFSQWAEKKGLNPSPSALVVIDA